MSKNIKKLIFAAVFAVLALLVAVPGVFSLFESASEIPAKAFYSETGLSCILVRSDGISQTIENVAASPTLQKTDTSHAYPEFTYVSSVKLDGEVIAYGGDNVTIVLDSDAMVSSSEDRWTINFGSATLLEVTYSAFKFDLSFNVKNAANTVFFESYSAGDTVTVLPRPTRRGYNFDGWYDVTSGLRYNAGNTVLADVSLEAKWAINEPYLGDVPLGGRTVVYGDPVMLCVDGLSPEISYSFVWLKRGSDGVWSAVDGAEDYRLTLKNVSDSGEYRLKIGFRDPQLSATAYEELYSDTATVTILRRTVGVSLRGAEGLLYDGKPKTVGAALTGLAYGDAPSFSIVGNRATDVGSYTLRVYNLTDANYELPPMTEFDYEIRKGCYSFSESSMLPALTLDASGGFLQGSAISYSTASVPQWLADETASLRYECSYGLALSGGFEGAIRVSLKATEEQISRKNFKAYIYVDSADPTNYQVVDARIEGQYIVFETDVLGDFVIFSGAYFKWWMWLLAVLFALMVIGASILVSIVLTRPKKPILAVPQSTDNTQGETQTEPMQTMVDNASENIVSDSSQDATEVPADLRPEILSPAVNGVDLNLAFQRKMAEADKTLVVWYSELKNALLMYQGVKSRVSGSCDSFRRARVLLAKITLIGTTIRVSLALDPAIEKYNNGCFPHRDKGDKPMYKDVPFQIKVKTDLGLRRALTLIEDVMVAHKIKRDPNYERIDYTKQYQGLVDNN